MTTFTDSFGVACHQRYSDLTDSKVREDICALHGRQAFPLIAELSPNARLLTDIPPIKLSEYCNNEIEFWPGLTGEIKLGDDTSTPAAISRDRSAANFDDTRPISFQFITRLLRFALAKNEKQPFSRAYPSAGALYPIEVFLCRLSDNIVGWPEVNDVLRVRPNRRELESMECDLNTAALRQILLGGDSVIGRPHFALVYAAFIDKFIFKYRYRGYRHSLMEVGSMYMLADLHGKHLGLKNRLWSGFYDNAVVEALNLDPETMIPCIVQLFGAGASAK